MFCSETYIFICVFYKVWTLITLNSAKIPHLSINSEQKISTYDYLKLRHFLACSIFLFNPFVYLQRYSNWRERSLRVDELLCTLPKMFILSIWYIRLSRCTATARYPNMNQWRYGDEIALDPRLDLDLLRCLSQNHKKTFHISK